VTRTAAGLAAIAAVLLSAVPAAADTYDPAATSEWHCPHWGMYGRVKERTFDADCETSISPATAPTLIPRWFFKTPTTVTASPAVVDGVVYVGDWTPTFYALDANSGEAIWQVDAPRQPNAPFGPIVSSAAVADTFTPNGLVRLVIFGSGNMLVALDAVDGSTVWQLDVAGALGPDEETEIESSPVVHDGVVYVGMDTHGKTLENTIDTRGGLLAVDAATGTSLWKFEPDHLDQAGCASVWSSPAIDADAGLVFTATGNCPIDDYEWGPHTEAVTALDLASGEPVWAFQPEPDNTDDTDFGATPNVFEVDGRQVVGIGKKNARYYLLDALTGELIWERQVTEPGNVQENFAVGGFIGSTAVGDGRVFGGTAISFNPSNFPAVTGPFHFHALDAASGEIAWQFVQGPVYAATSYTNGVVFNGALDAFLHVYDAELGIPLAALPTSGPVSSGPAIVGDWVFMGAGTSSSDLCAKDQPYSEACFAVFDGVLGGLGGVHAWSLPGADPVPGDGQVDARDDPPSGSRPDGAAGGPGPGPTPTTGGGLALVAMSVLALASVRRGERRGR